MLALSRVAKCQNEAPMARRAGRAWLRKGARRGGCANAPAAKARCGERKRRL